LEAAVEPASVEAATYQAAGIDVAEPGAGTAG
jgi:hypothetical protein